MANLCQGVDHATSQVARSNGRSRSSQWWRILGSKGLNARRSRIRMENLVLESWENSVFPLSETTRWLHISWWKKNHLRSSSDSTWQLPHWMLSNPEGDIQRTPVDSQDSQFLSSQDHHALGMRKTSWRFLGKFQLSYLFSGSHWRPFSRLGYSAARTVFRAFNQPPLTSRQCFPVDIDEKGVPHSH